MKKIIILLTAFAFAAVMSVKAADGADVYAKNCAKCHGEDGKGATKMGEKLGCKDYTKEAVNVQEGIKAVKEGLKEDGKTKMAPFGSKLSDDEIKAAVEHVASFKK